MNALLLNIIIQTIPKTPANEYEEAKLIVKSIKSWKNDIYTYALLMIVAVAAFLGGNNLNIPYVGFFLMLFGVIGFLAGFFFLFRAIVIYKNYYQIFKEEDFQKIEK